MCCPTYIYSKLATYQLLLDDRKKLLKNNIIHMNKLKPLIPANILAFLLPKLCTLETNLGFYSLKFEQMYK